jgi:hypothetical protein
MSFISGGGGSTAPKWSQITIDTDKDMGGHALTDIKQLVASMVGGDLVAKGTGGVLVRVPASTPNTVLTSNGPGQVPSFQPGGTSLNRFIPAQINSVNAAAVVTPDAAAKSAPVSSVYVAVYQDTPASDLKLVSPLIGSVNSAAVVSPGQTVAQTTPGKLTRHVDMGLSVVAAVSYLGGSYTNETTVAQHGTANGMHLMASSPVVGDAYYFAYSALFDQLLLVLGTQGVGNWGFTWQYWNGAWTTLPGINDTTNSFMNAAGQYFITFTRPGDWATTSVDSLGPYYWIRAYLGSYSSKTTTPLGSGAVCIVNGVI